MCSALQQHENISIPSVKFVQSNLTLGTEMFLCKAMFVLHFGNTKTSLFLGLNRIYLVLFALNATPWISLFSYSHFTCNALEVRLAIF